MSERPELSVIVERESDIAVVRVHGEVDLVSSPLLRERLLSLLEREPARVIIELSGVTHIDSSGIGTLVEFKRKYQRGKGPVVLAGMTARIHGLLEVTRLDKFFLLSDNVDSGRTA